MSTSKSPVASTSLRASGVGLVPKHSNSQEVLKAASALPAATNFLSKLKMSLDSQCSLHLLQPLVQPKPHQSSQKFFRQTH